MSTTQTLPARTAVQIRAGERCRQAQLRKHPLGGPEVTPAPDRLRPLPAPTNRQRDSSEASFESFYRDEYHSVVGLGYVLLGNGNLAEDLAQDAFAAAHQQWAKLCQYDKPEAWVRRVLINKSRSRRRRVVSEHKAVTILGARRVEVIELPERSEGVWNAVRSLPPRQAQVIALRYWDGLAVIEIAEVLGCGSETVKTHLKRAKATLAAKLASERGTLTAR